MAICKENRMPAVGRLPPYRSRRWRHGDPWSKYQFRHGQTFPVAHPALRACADEFEFIIATTAPVD
jgi:hypothetical protein